MWTAEDTLRAAEKVERIVKGDEPPSDDLIKVLEQLPPMPNFSPPISVPPPQWDCGCPPYGACMNTACPRRIRVTYGSAGFVTGPTDGVGWPD